MDNRQRVVVVTGASSGIGNACATFLAKKGYKVYGTCRNPGVYARKADEFFEMLALDLTDDGSVTKAGASILAKAGKVDALVCCAGMGIAGPLEECSMAEIHLQLDSNLYGTIRTIKAFLPAMREAGSGKILVFGSVAGLVGMPFQGLYSAGKFALEGLVESLRHEIRPFGIGACIVEPGDFRTGFTAARRFAAATTQASPYWRNFQAVMGVQTSDEAHGAHPLAAARTVARLIEARRLPIRRVTGPFFYRLVAFCKRVMPGRLFEGFYRLYYKLH